MKRTIVSSSSHLPTKTTLLPVILILLLSVAKLSAQDQDQDLMDMDMDQVFARQQELGETETKTPNDAIIPEGEFHKEQCYIDENCYSLLPHSLVCVNGTCECATWKDRKQLQFSNTHESRPNVEGWVPVVPTLCLGAPGHPCLLNFQCKNNNCVNRMCSGTGRRRSFSILLLLAQIGLMSIYKAMFSLHFSP